eukprot:scpid31968/ scgid5805/ Vacuolar protein sorting-associated protein 9a; Vacuolar protein-targeting protein 9a
MQSGGGAFDVRKSISKYDGLHEKLWARSRDAVLKRNRIDASEYRMMEACSNEEERLYNRRLCDLRKRALDYSIKELAIEISHVSDVLESLRQVQAAQDTGSTSVDESRLSSLAFERYEEWAGSSHELYALRSQALEVASEIMRVRSQRPKTPDNMLTQENDISMVLGRMRSHTRSFTSSTDEPDGLAADATADIQMQSMPRPPASGREWWERLLDTSSRKTPQQTYLKALFNTSGHVQSFEARKILEYVEECERFSATVLSRRSTASCPGGSGLDMSQAMPANHAPAAGVAVAEQDGGSGVLSAHGIEPRRFHEFMAAMSYYVVEQQRELHNEEWDEEEVQLILEEHVMSSVRPMAKAYTAKLSEDAKIKKKCEMLAFATQEQLGVPKEYISTELVPFYEAIALLRSMFFALTPSKKLFCVASAANAVFEQLSNVGVDLRKVGADVFMDVWVYVIVKANVSDLVSNMAFMSEYAVRSLSTGQAGYFLASLQVATSAILRIDPSALLSATDSVGSIVVCQREKYFQLAQQSVSHFEVVSPCQTLVGYRMCAVREWMLNATKFYSVVLRHTPDDSDAVVSVAVVKFNMKTVTPPQLEFLKKIFLPSDEPDFYVMDTPLGKAVCVKDDVSSMSLLELDCHDYEQVEQSLLDGLAIERLGVSSSDGCLGSRATTTSSSSSDESAVATVSSAGPFKRFSPACISSLEVNFRREYSVLADLSLHDAISSVVKVVQSVCHHLEHLSSLACVDGVYSDLLYEAVKSFKHAHKEANAASGACSDWSDDGVLTPQVFAAMKATLNAYMSDLANLGFLLPYGMSSCDTSERVRTHVRQVISSCQRGWHLPVHIHGSLGKKTRDEIKRRMAMLNNLRPAAKSKSNSR